MYPTCTTYFCMPCSELGETGGHTGNGSFWGPSSVRYMLLMLATKLFFTVLRDSTKKTSFNMAVCTKRSTPEEQPSTNFSCLLGKYSFPIAKELHYPFMRHRSCPRKKASLSKQKGFFRVPNTKNYFFTSQRQTHHRGAQSPHEECDKKRPFSA